MVASINTAHGAFESPARESFLSECKGHKLHSALALYAYASRIGIDDISGEIRSKIEALAAPGYELCACMASNLSVEEAQGKEWNIRYTDAIAEMVKTNQCTKERAGAVYVERDIFHLAAKSQPVQKILKNARTPIVLDFAIDGKKSLYASYSPPPDELPRLVLVSPFSGSACSPNDLCVDKAPLGLVSAEEFFHTESSLLGEEGIKNLKRTLKELNVDTPVVTSGRNYTNFVPVKSKGIYEYRIESIDGVPIEKTRIKEIWIVVFTSGTPKDSRAINFLPALVSVVKIEFQD